MWFIQDIAMKFMLSIVYRQADGGTSFLWRIAVDPPSYFFGTIHVPYSRVWDYVPDNVKKAFDASDAVFFELDLTDPNTISALTSCQLLPVIGSSFFKTHSILIQTICFPIFL